MAQHPNLQNSATTAQDRCGPQIPRDTKRRKLDHRYIDICDLVKGLRPHFIELRGIGARSLSQFSRCSESKMIHLNAKVLRTPDFRNSKAAHEIRRQTKLLLDICEQITSGVNPPEETRKLQDNHRLADEKKPTSRSEYFGNGRAQQGHVVGGSNFGWNFIMYPGGDAVYYGVTKESFIASHQKKEVPTD